MRSNKNRYDFYNPNFESWFKGMVDNMTEVQRNRLPEDILFKLSKGKKGISGSMSFNEACYVLSVCFNKEIIIMLKDEDNGMTVVDFAKVRKAKKREISNTELLAQPRTPATFVLADKSLFESAMYLSHVYTTDIWKLMNNFNELDLSLKANAFVRGKDTVRALARLITNYDMYKKRIIMELHITTGILYGLLYFCSGEKYGSSFYNEDFKYAYNANRSDMFEALHLMEFRGLLFRRGEKRKPLYSLTGAGYDMLDKVLRIVLKLYKI